MALKDKTDTCRHRRRSGRSRNHHLVIVIIIAKSTCFASGISAAATGLVSAAPSYPVRCFPATGADTFDWIPSSVCVVPTPNRIAAPTPGGLPLPIVINAPRSISQSCGCGCSSNWTHTGPVWTGALHLLKSIHQTYQSWWQARVHQSCLAKCTDIKNR